MALSRSRRDSGMNYWPGFVDALSTLILSIIFLLTVFMVAQFFLSQEVAGKDTALARLNAQISRLSDLLSLERTGKTNLEDEIAQLRASLSAAQGERDRMRGAAGVPAPSADNDKAEIGKLSTQVDSEKQVTARAVAQIEILNQQIGARRRTRHFGEQGKVGPTAHRRSRPAAQRRARPARPGALALPLGLLWQAARDPRQPPGYPRRRRPVRVPVGSVLRFRRRGAAAGRTRRTRQARRRAA